MKVKAQIVEKFYDIIESCQDVPQNIITQFEGKIKNGPNSKIHIDT